MGETYLVEFTAPWSIVSRRPGLFDVGVHGPGAEPEASLYPWPPHVAGILAGLAYEAQWSNEVSGSRECPAESALEEEFSDTRSCLRRLLGDEYRIYLGMARVGSSNGGDDGRVMVLVGDWKLHSIGVVWRALENAARHLLSGEGVSASSLSKMFTDILKEDEDAAKPTVFRRVGIALRRGSKTVSEAMLYVQPESFLLDKRTRAEIRVLALVESSMTLPVNESRVMRLGADNKPGVLWFRKDAGAPASFLYRRLNSNGSRDSCLALLFTISPTVISGSPTTVEGVMVPGSEGSKHLSESLLGASGAVDDAEPIPPYLAQVGGSRAKVLSVGWSMARGYLRRPMLVMPPGLLVPVRLRECSGKSVEKLLRRGVGEHTDLGWGTVMVLLF